MILFSFGKPSKWAVNTAANVVVKCLPRGVKRTGDMIMTIIAIEFAPKHDAVELSC